MKKELTPQAYYNKGLSDRKPFEDRAEKFANWSIPALFRKTGSSGSSDIPDEYSQSLVAMCVKNLSSKMAMTLFPPSASGFKLSPDMDALNQLTQGNEDVKSQINMVLSDASDRVNRAIEIQNIRNDIFDVTDQLLVVGSCIMEKVPNEGIKVHGLRSFVVSLDDMGRCVKMCIREVLEYLPSELIEFEDEKTDEYTLYTMSTLDRKTKTWEMVQSLDDVEVSRTKYKEDKFLFEYVGWAWSIGEKYHRPYIEDLRGLVYSYNQLSQLLTEGALISSKSLVFVNERGGRTSMQDVAMSKHGDVIQGDAADVTSFQHNKNMDYQVPFQMLQSLANSLKEAFLLKSSITRQAERVTAEEIRQMATDLENLIAGVYAKTASKASRRVVVWIMNELKLSIKKIGVDIVTGLNALGMNNEISKLDGFMTRLSQLQLTSWVNSRELADRYANGYGVNTINLLKTPQQVQQEQQQAQQQQAMQSMYQSGAQKAGENMGNQLTGGQVNG